MAQHPAKQHPNYDPLLSVADAATYLGMHTDTLKRLARRREIASVRALSSQGSPTKFRLSALNDWIRKNEIRPLRSFAHQ